MIRNPWLSQIERLDPEREYEEIFRLHFSHEFPWDSVQALSFALFRTYAVPSIGNLLNDTGEFTARVQKRYDDTNLLMDQVVESGFVGEGRAAIRRINQMHGAYDISNEDFVYVLATFVVVPVRWIQKFGWRALTENEIRATVLYYREFGRHMGLKQIPDDYDGFARLLDDYERDHFAFSEGGRAVADSTLDLLTTFAPYRYLPQAFVRRMALALMDTELLEAFHYRVPTRMERFAAEGALKLRGVFVKALPPRLKAFRAREQEAVRSYPDGYKISELGTFPRGCPVPHDRLTDTNSPIASANNLHLEDVQ